MQFKMHFSRMRMFIVFVAAVSGMYTLMQLYKTHSSNSLIQATFEKSKGNIQDINFSFRQHQNEPNFANINVEKDSIGKKKDINFVNNKSKIVKENKETLHVEQSNTNPDLSHQKTITGYSRESEEVSSGKVHEKEMNLDEKEKAEATKSIDKSVVAQQNDLQRQIDARVSTKPTKKCSSLGSKLVGPLFVDQSIPGAGELERILSVKSGGLVENGGWWQPIYCKPRIKVAIIIPYRNRQSQLIVFLRHMHQMLMRQLLYYRIFVIEQLEQDPFNRAGLFNIGFTESKNFANFDCYIFTDVDLLPEDDRNYYGCPTSPRHMSVAVDKFNYMLPYQTIFGGVEAFTKDHFEAINGMSNLFWGWGGEDDDLYNRIKTVGYKLTRPSLLIGRYTMLKKNHFQSSKADPNRMHLLHNSDERMTVDGLNTLKYTLTEIEEQPLATFVKVIMKKSMYNV